MILVAIGIRILERTTFYTYIFERFTNVETTLQHTAGNNVLQSGTHNRVALTWLYVEEVNTEIKFAIHADASSLLNVL